MTNMTEESQSTKSHYTVIK